MSIKLKLTSQNILEKKFQGSTPGYNPLQVDEFLDKVLKDYRTVEANVLILKKELEEMKSQIESLTKANNELDIKVLKYEKRLSSFKEADTVTSENMDLLKRIDSLEKFIYDKGYDPSKIK